MSKSILGVLLTLLSLTGWSADSEKGLRAFLDGDHATALREWTPLAETGDVDAQFWVGEMYRGIYSGMYNRGAVVQQDYKTAVKWYTRAAEQGHAGAQVSLGTMYANGDGVPVDDKTAVKWYTRAAEQGYANAQTNLGLMYLLGRGVLQDNVYAHMWFNMAASAGSGAALKLLDSVVEDMTAEDISKAQQLARDCVFQNYKDC